MSRRRLAALLFVAFSIAANPPPPPPPPPPEGDRPSGRMFTDEGGNTVDLYPGGFVPGAGVSLPVEFLDTTRGGYTGHTPIVVSSETALTTAFEQADLAGGGVIQIEQGTEIFSWNMPPRTTSGWIWIETRNAEGYSVNDGAQILLPAGERVTPTVGQRFARFSTVITDHAISVSGSAHHVRFRSISVGQRLGDNDGFALVVMSPDAHHIIFEQCYFTQNKYGNLRCGLKLTAHHSAVIDCWFDCARSRLNEAQSINYTSNQGVVKVVNNYLSGAGECFMVGGGDPQDPEDATIKYYPKDLEFRRNHSMHHRWYYPWTPEWAAYWDQIDSDLTVASSDAASITVTGGTFNVNRLSANRIHYYVYVVSGPQAGTYGDIGSYSADGTIAYIDRWYGTPPTSGTIEVRNGNEFVYKNLFEIKNNRRAVVAENIFEGMKTGLQQQYYAIVMKSVNQSGGNGSYSTCSDVCFYDNLIFGVSGGLGLSRAPETPAIDMNGLDIVNNLFIGNGLSLNTTRESGMQISGDSIRMYRNTFARFRERLSFCYPGVGIDLQRNVFAHRDGADYGWTSDPYIGNPKDQFPVLYDSATSRINSNGFMNPYSSINTADHNIDGSEYMTGNVAVHVEANVRFAAMGYDFFGASDWGLADDTPFQDVDGKWGVDYPELQSRLYGVRADESDAPTYDWEND